MSDLKTDKMKFGTSQLNNPTPASISVKIDFLVGFLSIVISFVTMASFIPQNVSDPISTTINGLFIPSLLLLKRFFGTQISETKVDVDDVAEIKDK